MAATQMGEGPARMPWPPQCWHMIREVDLVRLVAEHSAWLRLCARLEALADDLPALPDEDDMRLLRAQIEGLTQSRRGSGEATLDALFTRERARPLARTLLDGFQLARAARIIDLDDILTALESRDTPANTIGYMMRSFFRGCRSAIAIEQLSLLTLGSGRLTGDARALLMERLIESSSPG